MNRFVTGCALATCGLVLAVGCTSSITGNEGNLDFSYTADDDITNFNKPIAVGARLELRVVETGTRATVEIEEASSTDEEVLAVETFTSNRVILRGVGEGEARIEVRAQGEGGEVVTDSVDMLGAVPDELQLRHPCTLQGGTAKYLAGTHDVHIGFDMAESSGQAVIGYGYFPIEITPPDAVSLDESSTDQANFHLDIGEEPGLVTLASTIDATMLELDVITQGSIDGLETATDTVREVRVDETIFVSVLPTSGGERVCASNAEFEIENLTPDLCEVRAAQPPDAENEGLTQRTGFVQVTGRAFGICRFEALYPNGAEGAGASAEVEVEVGEFPDADE